VIVLDIVSDEESLPVRVENAVLLGWGNGDPGFKEVERPAGTSASLTVKPFANRAQVLVRSIEGASGSATVIIGPERSRQLINFQYITKSGLVKSNQP
jgi:beta-galactosidase